MKRKLLFLMALAISAFTWNAKAQTDVTSQYITNAGFDTAGDFQTGNIATGGSNQRKDVTGWSNYGGDTYTTGGCIGFGTTGQINGANIPSTNSDGVADGGALALNAAWQSSVYYSQEVTLPAGHYQFKFMVNNVGKNDKFNKDPTLFAFTTNKYTFCGNVNSYPVNTWTEQKIEFGLPEQATGTLKIGYKADNTGSGNTPKLVVDYVKAFYVANYTSTLQSTITSAQALYARSNNADLNTAITHAQSVLAAADNTVAYQGTIDEEVTALNSAMATALSSVVLLEGEDISFMIQNFDFESGTPVTVGITTYDYDCGNNGTYYSQQQTVEGWTIDTNGNARSGGVFEFGGSPWLGSTGNNFKAPASASETGQTKALGIVGVWSSTVQYKQPITLPAGAYVIEIPIYNTAGTAAFSKNLIGFVENSGTEHLSTTTSYATGSWKTETITFNLDEETSGYFSLGYNAANKGSGDMPHLFIDYVKVIYTSPIAAAKYAWDDALAAAIAARDNADYTNVKGVEKANLLAEIEKDEPTTLEGYEFATIDLENATRTFIAAAPSYNTYSEALTTQDPNLQYASNEKKTAFQNSLNAGNATSAEDAIAKTNAIVTTLRAYYESHAMGESENAVDFSSSIINGQDPTTNDNWTWTGAKNNPASNQPWIASTDDPNNPPTHTYFDGGNWSANSWTTTMEQVVSLPAGRYLLTAKARAATNTTLTMTVGANNVVLQALGSSGNVFGNGWGDISVEFETAGQDVTINVTATSSTQYEWFSISDFRLVQLEAIEIPMADAADYQALADAISAVSGNVLGFEVGEYAPYTNKEAVIALKAAQAIDPQVADGNTKEIVQSATTALTSATWTANTVEMNGFYNGDWSQSELTPIVNGNYQTGTVDAPGWTSVQGMRVIFGDIENNPGLEYASANRALFSWGGTTITYGEQTGYTLPLKANTGYVMTAKISGWRDGDLPSWVGLTVENATVYGENAVSGTGKINVAEGDPFVTVVFKFKTGEEAGDYVVNLSVNKHFTITDLTLFKAPQATVNVNIPANVKYATRIFPFEPVLPEGVVAYSCSEVVNGTLTLEAVSAPKANVPYILEAESGCASTDLTDYDMSIKDIYTSGLLTGVYTSTAAPAGSYVLQKLNDKVAFYKVVEGTTEEEKITVPAYRAYLTAPAASGVKVLNFGPVEDTTGINAIEALTSGKAEIYNAAGVRVSKLEKGVNIIRTADGKTQKVLVK